MNQQLDLGGVEKAFTQGGNRLCFFHPDDATRCIKVVRPDRTPEIRRKQKAFPKNLKPLSRFDENKNELNEINKIKRFIGEEALELIPKYYGMIETNLGPGLCSDMIVDDDNRVSLSLKQYLWVNGLNVPLLAALEAFKQKWIKLSMPSRDLLLHNIVVEQIHCQSDISSIHRLVVIDGLGWPGFSWLYDICRPLAVTKARKKIQRLDMAIEQLLDKKEKQADWGYHGWLNEEQRVVKSNG